jgi:hypothetical protein
VTERANHHRQARQYKSGEEDVMHLPGKDGTTRYADCDCRAE